MAALHERWRISSDARRGQRPGWVGSGQSRCYRRQVVGLDLTGPMLERARQNLLIQNEHAVHLIRGMFLATSSLEGLRGERNDGPPRLRLDRARRATYRALSELSAALREHRLGVSTVVELKGPEPWTGPAGLETIVSELVFYW